MSHQIMITGTASIGLAKGKDTKGADPQAQQAFDRALDNSPRESGVRAEPTIGEKERSSRPYFPMKDAGLPFQARAFREMAGASEDKKGEKLPPIDDGIAQDTAELPLEDGAGKAMPVDVMLEIDAESEDESTLGETVTDGVEATPDDEDAPTLAPPPPVDAPIIPERGYDGRGRPVLMPDTVLAASQAAIPGRSTHPFERPMAGHGTAPLARNGDDMLRTPPARLAEIGQGTPTPSQRTSVALGRSQATAPTPSFHAPDMQHSLKQDGRDRSRASAGNGRIGELIGRVSMPNTTDKPAETFGARVSVVSSQSSPVPVAINAAATPLPGTPAAQVVAAIREDADPATRSSGQAAEVRDIQLGRPRPVQTIQIQLHPLELGRVTARMSMVNGQLSVELQVETGRARAQLAGDSDSIVKSLKSAGYDVDRVSVQQASSAGNAGAASSQERGGAHTGEARSEESEQRTGRDRDRRSQQERGQDGNESLAGEPRRGGLYI